MKHKTTLSTFLVFTMAASATAQLVTRPDAFSASGVSNEGLVVGYLTQAGSYLIWNPDLSTTEDIGGVAPGNGVGGQGEFSVDGEHVCGASEGPDGPEISSYDMGTGTWAAHGGLGVALDGTVGGGYGISADGGTVVGLSWASGGSAHAVAWNATEGLMDLGSLFSNTSTRANAVSGDGNTVVGWQDFNGPWKSAVWRKDPSGGYYPNEYLLIDEGGSATDENNQLGQCSAISSDGTVIGGYGDFANNGEPWIWSEATGAVDLGALPNMGRGYVSSMNSDGTIVVGWFDGQDFGEPRKAFIWTAADGLQDLNVYVTNTMGIPLGSQQLYTASDISPNGLYITGTGVGAGFSQFAYRLGLDITTGIAALNDPRTLNVYPNPVLDAVHFRSPAAAELTIASADGSVVQRAHVEGDVSVDLSHLSAGVYTMCLRSEGSVSTQRIIKR